MNYNIDKNTLNLVTKCIDSCVLVFSLWMLLLLAVDVENDNREIALLLMGQSKSNFSAYTNILKIGK